MHEQFGDQVNIVGVAGRDTVEDMQTFVTTTGVTALDHIADEDGDIWSQYGITSQPAWAFINDDGSVETLVAALGKDGLTERVEDLLRR